LFWNTPTGQQAATFLARSRKSTVNTNEISGLNPTQNLDKTTTKLRESDQVQKANDVLKGRQSSNESKKRKNDSEIVNKSQKIKKMSLVEEHNSNKYPIIEKHSTHKADGNTPKYPKMDKGPIQAELKTQSKFKSKGICHSNEINPILIAKNSWEKIINVITLTKDVKTNIWVIVEWKNNKEKSYHTFIKAKMKFPQQVNLYLI
jgi:hypothetical protein